MNKLNRHRVGLLCVMAMSVVAAVMSGSSVGFPEPAPVARYWQFDFTVGRPMLISDIDANGEIQWYWYIAYKVENNTGEDRLFIPEMQAATDTGHVIAAGPTLPNDVFARIKKRVRNSLLEHPSAIVDTLLQGPDHARESVICWPAPKDDVDHYRVFISGLSGEIQKVPDPQTGETVTLRKTLMLEYATPGSYPLEKDQPVLPQAQRWIMR